MKALDAVRRHPWRTFVALWIISALVVIAFVPSRMKGTRDGRNAFIPLRAATPDELADLLDDARAGTWPHTGVVAIDGNTLTVHTRVYLLDEPEDDSSECSWRKQEREAVGKRPLCSASWEGYVIRHRVARDALEESLGYETRVENLDVALAGEPVSHDPRWLPLYVLLESLVLALLCAIPLLAAARFGFGTLLTALFFGCLVLLPAIFVYSPAWMDADYFHQRIVLEHLLTPASMLLVPLGGAVLISLAATLALWRHRRRHRAEVDAA